MNKVAGLSISRAWDDTKAVFRRNGRLFVTIALAFGVLPGLFVGFLMPSLARGSGMAQGLLLVLLVGTTLVSLNGQLAIQRMAIGGGERVGDAIRAAFPRAAKALVAMLLIIFPVAFFMSPFLPAFTQGNEAEQASAAGAMLLIILLALIPISRFLLSLPVAAIERVGLLSILGRSWRLTRRNWLRMYGLIIGFLFLLGVVSWAALASLGSVVVLLAGQPEPGTLSALLIGLVSQVGQTAVVLPFTLILACLYYQAVARENEVTVPHAP